MNYTISLSHGYKSCDTIFLRKAVQHAQQIIMQSAWDNRPQFDEDAGVFVSQNNSRSLNSALDFALLTVCQQYQELFKESDEEHRLLNEAYIRGEETGILPIIEIHRSFKELDIACIIQLLFLFMEDLDKIYESDERDMYESDNHYTGKLLSYFIEQSKQRAKEDRKLIYKLINKFSGSTKI
jgi:hypothetical protein